MKDLKKKVKDSEFHVLYVKLRKEFRQLPPVKWYNCVLVRGHSYNNTCKPKDRQLHEGVCPDKQKKDIWRFAICQKVCCFEDNLSEIKRIGIKNWGDRGKIWGPRLRGGVAFGVNGFWNLFIGVWGLDVQAIKALARTLNWKFFGPQLALFILILVQGTLNMVHAYHCLSMNNKDLEEKADFEKNKDMTYNSPHDDFDSFFTFKTYGKVLTWSMHHNALCAPISALMSIPVMVSLGIPEYNEDGLRIIYNAIPLYTSFAIYLVMAFLNYFWFAGWMFFSYERMWYTCPADKSSTTPPPETPCQLSTMESRKASLMNADDVRLAAASLSGTGTESRKKDKDKKKKKRAPSSSSSTTDEPLPSIATRESTDFLTDGLYDEYGGREMPAAPGGFV